MSVAGRRELGLGQDIDAPSCGGTVHSVDFQDGRFSALISGGRSARKPLLALAVHEQGTALMPGQMERVFWPSCHRYGGDARKMACTMFGV